MPKKKWRLGTREGWDDTLVINTHEPETELWSDVYDPETNDTQFRALVEWCASQGYVFVKIGEKWGGCRLIHGNTYFPLSVYPELVDCMTSIVIGHEDSDNLEEENSIRANAKKASKNKQSSESGEVDCG